MIKKTALYLLPLCAPFSLFAQYVPLSINLPGGADEAFGGGVFPMLNYFFTLSIGVAAILAVIILVIGGFRYMTTKSSFSLGDSKEQMWNAIIGLLVVLSAVLVLSYVNPDIVNFQLFRN